MRIVVTGASGLVGSRLVPHLMAAGHQVTAVTREPEAHRFPRGVQVLRWDARGPFKVPGGCDAVVHLLGERVIGKRWTLDQKRRIHDSRIDSTRRIAEWISAQPVGLRPALVCASAVGYYGAWPEGACPEERQPGADFLARLCAEWEEAARAAGGRVVSLRFGHVLDGRGGYIGSLLPFARFGGAGRIGSGRQPMPWVHVGDLCRAITWACTTASAQGAYNAVSPGAAGTTQAEFARAFAKAYGRPQLPVPGLAMKVKFGKEAAPVLLGGQDARAVRLESEGFRFQHLDAREALEDLLG